jgi:hypothetical protein
MATWYEHAGTTFDPDAGLFSEDMKGLVTNVAAGLEGANNAPYNEATWHPYNGLKVGDANTGVIYDFATTGALTTITTPDFVDGYEYMLRVEGLVTSNAAEFQISLYSEAAAAFTTYADVTTVPGNAGNFGEIEISVPRATTNRVNVYSRMSSVAAAADPITHGGASFTLTLASKVLRARISNGFATTAGRIIMYKRRAFY